LTARTVLDEVVRVSVLPSRLRMVKYWTRHAALAAGLTAGLLGLLMFEIWHDEAGK
jgi:hypothetical protein